MILHRHLNNWRSLPPRQTRTLLRKRRRRCSIACAKGVSSWLVLDNSSAENPHCINALIDDELLPSGVAPVTSAITIVRFGERRARVRLGLDDWREVRISEVANYVSEAENPENQKGVTGVELFCPSPLLAHGLCLVDTPGIGSVFAGNTEATRSFVPQIDAAIVVLGGDPPISGDELELLETVSKQVKDVLLVLNKADRLSDDDIREARAFTSEILAKRANLTGSTLYALSALDRLRKQGPERDWPLFVLRLQELAQNGGARLVEQAAARGFASLIDRLHRHVREEREALLRPVDESERRLDELRRCATEAEQSLVELTHLFNAEQQKLARRFDDERMRFIERALPQVAKILDQKLAQTSLQRGPQLRKSAFDEAYVITQDLVRSWMLEQRPYVEREFAGVTERFTEQANAFLERLRSSGQLPADALPEKLVPETGLRARSTFFFRSVTPLAHPLLTWLMDVFLSATAARKAAQRDGLEFARQLLEVNANRVLGDFNDRIVESRRSVESALRRTLTEVVSVAESAARRAAEIRHQGEQAVKDAVARLDAYEITLDKLAVLVRSCDELRVRERFSHL